MKKLLFHLLSSLVKPTLLSTLTNLGYASAYTYNKPALEEVCGYKAKTARLRWAKEIVTDNTYR